MVQDSKSTTVVLTLFLFHPILVKPNQTAALVQEVHFLSPVCKASEVFVVLLTMEEEDLDDEECHRMHLLLALDYFLWLQRITYILC